MNQSGQRGPKDTIRIGAIAFEESKEELAPATARSAATPIPPQPAVIFSDEASCPLRVGSTYGDYKITGRLGSGGFAEVCEAVQTTTGRRYALKVLNVVEGARKASVERFANECTTLSSLRKVDGVVKVYDTFVDPRAGRVLVMQRLEGKTLRDALIERRLSLLEKLWICIRIARAMALIHANRIIHRDLKPENIFLERGEGELETSADRFRPVILDLGCAKTDEGPTTSSTSLTATWQYASPEQLGRGALTARSDIYAFGCIMYEMFEGEQCFWYLDENAGAQTSTNIKVAWHVLMPAKLPATIPVVLWNEIVSICIEKDPDARFQAMQELEHALETFLRDVLSQRIPRDDFLPANLAGARARKPPEPLPAEDKRTLDRKASEVDAAARIDSPSLLVVEGPAALVGKRYAIGRTVILGRWLADEPRVGTGDVTFPLETLSTRHCTLTAALEGVAQAVYFVQDLKSTNGTQISGVAIKEGILRPGSTLRLGYELTLRLYGPGTIREQDERPRTGAQPAHRPALPRTRPMEAPVLMSPVLMSDAQMREVQLSEADLEARVASAVADDRARRSRTQRLIIAVVLVLLVAILAIGLQVFHVLPTSLGGSR